MVTLRFDVQDMLSDQDRAEQDATKQQILSTFRGVAGGGGEQKSMEAGEEEIRLTRVSPLRIGMAVGSGTALFRSDQGGDFL